MSWVDEQDAFLHDFSLLISYSRQLGFKVTAGELWRPIEMQKIYVETGRSQTMDTAHGRRCAGDLNFFWEGELCYDKAKLQPIGDFWEGLNPGKNKWGGNWKSFKDLPHFERRF